MDREEGVPGIAGFGLPLRYDTPAMDAISCSVPTARLAEGREQRIVAVLREIRDRIEAAAPRAGGAAPQWR
ncbi:hypothetical protein GCM10009863_62330 [Streptomyces axinellae]|uniref:IclR-ED domain-containing protein n=1 Tax=Streptomyces axinellae TaxID=552788 RepID=A0ABN3QX74_9ACTN